MGLMHTIQMENLKKIGSFRKTAIVFPYYLQKQDPALY